jgi:hypothetical protein
MILLYICAFILGAGLLVDEHGLVMSFDGNKSPWKMNSLTFIILILHFVPLILPRAPPEW